MTMHAIRLFEGDVDKLQQLHPRLGANKVIRELVRAHIRLAEESAQQSAPTIAPIQLEELDSE